MLQFTEKKEVCLEIMNAQIAQQEKFSMFGSCPKETQFRIER